MKAKKSIKKYTYDNNLNESITNHAHVADIREQLRQSLEQLEQSKLTIELENQKRILAEHQCQQIKEQNGEIKAEMQSIKKELNKLSKKYLKMRENQKHTCQKCKQNSQNKDNAERQREIFMKERGVLKNQIKELKRVIENFENKDTATITLAGNTRILDQMRRDLDDKNKVIDEQKKIIRYLDEKLSFFQVEKLQTLTYVESIDQRLQELQMENNILKGFATTQGLWKQKKGERGREKERERPMSFLESPNRRNGSIKNLQKYNKSRSRSRDSPKY